MLLDKEKSCVLLIDVQEKLTPLVQDSQVFISRCEWLLRLAQQMQIPVLISEQYPQGLGETIAPLKVIWPEQQAIEKVHFSCYRDPTFKQQLKGLSKMQLLLIGIETHVCVLQSAVDLQEAGYDVFVVVDAVSSRFELDKKYALKRMNQAGIQLVTSEMVFFEWVVKAGTAEFKALRQVYIN
jgi:nicotinamidase-related amidase